MQRFQLILGGISAISLVALFFNLTGFDSDARHERLWNELRLLGGLELRGNRGSSQSFYRQAYNEANSISPDNMLVSLSLSDLGNFEYQNKNFPSAISYFDRAIQMDNNLQKMRSMPCDSRLISEDLARLELMKARANDKLGNIDAARQGYLAALALCNARLGQSPLDWAVCDRADVAIAGGARLCRNRKEFEEVLTDVGHIALDKVPAGYRKNFKFSLTRSLNSVPQSDRAALAASMDQILPLLN